MRKVRPTAMICTWETGVPIINSALRQRYHEIHRVPFEGEWFWLLPRLQTFVHQSRKPAKFHNLKICQTFVTPGRQSYMMMVLKLPNLTWDTSVSSLCTQETIQPLSSPAPSFLGTKMLPLQKLSSSRIWYSTFIEFSRCPPPYFKAAVRYFLTCTMVN